MRVFATARLALGLVLAVVLVASAQEPTAAKPYELFKETRDLITSGKLALAAESLKAFLDSNPTDKDFLFIESRLGADVFLRLKRVVQWSENTSADAAANKTVDAVIARSVLANRNTARDPARITKFVKNLGASPAEQTFALDQLAFAGDAAAAALVSELRSTNDQNYRAGILLAIAKLPATVVPPVLASVDGVTDDLKGSVLKAIASRGDTLQLVVQAESNFLPALWFYSGSAVPSLKVSMTGLLNALTAGAAERTTPTQELVKLAEPLARHQAKFGSLDKLKNTVTVWAWDETKLAALPLSLPTTDAEEYLALRYLRWAVIRDARSDEAQAAFLRVLTERAVERTQFGELSTSDPRTYGLLASTPTPLLSNLLTSALAEKRTALALGLVQVLGARASKDSETLFVKALSYPDPRVQFGAAVALLRSPGSSKHGSSGQVVEILQKEIAGEIDPLEGKTGRAVIADPNSSRASRLSANFRELGYEPERFTSGKDLLRRLTKSSDIDVILLDRHIADPTFTDILGQLASNPNTAKRVIFLVASSDKTQTPSIELLLLRLAVLVAATETENVTVPEPYAFNPKFPDLDREKAAQQKLELREKALQALARARLGRLQRLVQASDLPSDDFLRDRLEARLPQLTYAVLAAEYGVNKKNAPQAQKQIDDYTALVKLQSRFDANIRKLTQTEQLMRIIEQMETALDADLKAKADRLETIIPLKTLQIEPGTYKDLDLMQKLSRQINAYRQVSVIAEPYSVSGLAEEMRQATPDAAQRPRTEAEKKATAKIAAMWLRKIASGEIQGYDAKPAEHTMRLAVRSDDLAPDIVAGLAHLGSSDTQLTLVTVAGSPRRTQPIRLAAADAANKHAQNFGKLTTSAAVTQLQQAAAVEKDAELRGKLTGLVQALSETAPDLSALIQNYTVSPRLPVPAPAPGPVPMKEAAPDMPPDNPKK